MYKLSERVSQLSVDNNINTLRAIIVNKMPYQFPFIKFKICSLFNTCIDIIWNIYKNTPSKTVPILSKNFWKLKIEEHESHYPPGGSNNFWDLFDYSIEQAFNVSQHIFIIGDLNVYLLRERNHRLNEIASFYELRNTIHEPTHMGSLLNPIFVSNCNLLIDCHEETNPNHNHKLHC
jgi:hypothetical protein